MLIGQLSDIHVLERRFERALLDAAIDELNHEAPDFVVVAGDLTSGGFRDQFEYARDRLGQLECENVFCVPGNHDSREAGYLHFEDIFGDRNRSATVTTEDGAVRVVCVDSTTPDADEGEVGRDFYHWIVEQFEAEETEFRVFVMHHHLVALPGTGRDRDTVADAGDVLELLRSLNVDLVLGGHRHVPHVWPAVGMFLVHSGTAATRRVRGYASPSYNLVTLTGTELTVEVREPGGQGELLARYNRPYAPEGEHRTVEGTKVLRDAESPGDGPVSADSRHTAGPRVDT